MLHAETSPLFGRMACKWCTSIMMIGWRRYISTNIMSTYQWHLHTSTARVWPALTRAVLARPGRTGRAGHSRAPFHGAIFGAGL